MLKSTSSTTLQASSPSANFQYDEQGQILTAMSDMQGEISEAFTSSPLEVERRLNELSK